MVGAWFATRSHQEAGKARLDWRAYDAEVGPFLNGDAIRRGGTAARRAGDFGEIRSPTVFETEDAGKAVLDRMGHALPAERLGRPSIPISLGRTGQPRLPGDAGARKRVPSASNPKLRNLVTMPFNEKLENVVQIWAPLVNCLEPKPGYADFCEPGSAA